MYGCVSARATFKYDRCKPSPVLALGDAGTRFSFDIVIELCDLRLRAAKSSRRRA